MGSTRNALAALDGRLDESMGIRLVEAHPVIAPFSNERNRGRRPLRNMARIDIERVVPDPDQPRTDFSEVSIERLAQSIRDRGQLLPIHVRWSDVHSKWIIISGERRWRAIRHARLPTIDCCFNEDDLTDKDILEQQLIENLLREDLNPLEQARAFSKLKQINSWSGKQVAAALQIPESTVSRSLALLRLPDDIQQQVHDGNIAARSAYELSKLPDPNTQQQLATDAAAGRLSHQQAARVVRQRRGKTDRKQASIRLEFRSESGFKTVVTANRNGTYHDVEAALVEALDEVRLRINNNIQLY